MGDDFPDVPLTNFGGETEVATQPVAPEAPAATEQTTPTEPQAPGSEGQPAAQPQQPEVNSNAEEQQSQGRPERRSRLDSRFAELTAQNKQKDALIEQMTAQLAQNSAVAGIPKPQPDENGEIPVDAILEYNQKVAQASANASATTQVNQLRTQLERESLANKLDSEGTQIETKYKEYFDADPTLMDDIREEVEERIKLANGNLALLKQISPAKIADRMMRSISAERRRSQTVTAQNLSETQANAAVAPETAPTQVDPNSDSALEERVANIKF